MKKVLFASTALALSAGYAAAEVELSGSAEMGIRGGDGVETQFHQDIDVTFTMSGETDGGLSFGAAVDLDEDASAVGSDDAGVAVFISGDFGTVTLGDTDGAMDWALTEGGNVGNPGSLGDDETSYTGYIGNYLDGEYDGQILRYDNTFGDFGVAVSVEMDDTGSSTIGTTTQYTIGASPVVSALTTTTAGTVERDPGFAVGFKYNLDLGGTTVALGLGYQQAEVVVPGTPTTITVDLETGMISSIVLGSLGTTADVSATGISAVATLDSGLAIGAAYSDWDIAGVDANLFQVGVGYSIDALSLHANYSRVDVDAPNSDEDGFGLAAAYDLGGGAKVHLGYGSGGVEGSSNVDTFSFGLKMSF